MSWPRKVYLLSGSFLVLLAAKGGLDDEHALGLLHVWGRKVAAVLLVCRLAAGREEAAVEAFHLRSSLNVACLLRRPFPR